MTRIYCSYKIKENWETANASEYESNNEAEEQSVKCYLALVAMLSMLSYSRDSEQSINCW